MTVQQRMRLLEVSIIPDDAQQSLGHSLSRGVFGRLTPDFSSSGQTIRNVERRVMVLHAGDVAVAIWNRRAHAKLHANGEAGTEHDTAVALSMLQNVCGSDEEVQAWYKLLRIGTIQTLCDPFLWPAASALAAQLLKEKRVGGARATRIIQEAIQSAVATDYDFEALLKAREYLLKRC